MKKLVLILSLISSVAFCNDIDILRTSSNILNSYTPNFHKNIKQSLDNKVPLHGRELRLLHEVVSHYIDLDTKFTKLIKSEKSKKIKVLLNLDRYKSFLTNFEPFYSTTRFRRYINDEDLSFNIKKHQLNDHITLLLDLKFAKTLNKDIETALSNGTSDDYSIQIENHSALEFVKNLKKIKALNKLYKKFKKSDLKDDRLIDLTDRISGRFGNTAGGIRWRKGHLLKNKKIHAEILEQLKPLDMITEKTYFALTDKFIPGHFGHNAIWLGTKEELIELGLWNHKSIIPFHKEIEAGKSILEVDRSGTHLKSLEVFMNIDEFAILRLKEINFTTARLEEIYTVALSQIGKIYDFNFDVETTDKLVCSELLYQSFTNIHWPTQTYLTNTKLSRVTISPDNIASLALYNDSPIELIYYVAQRKKRQAPIYKDLDQLAKDLEFAKVGDEYKRVVKKCDESLSNVELCETELEDLPYTSHPYIEGVGI
jgi:uncharacterized protein YycO